MTHMCNCLKSFIKNCSPESSCFIIISYQKSLSEEDVIGRNAEVPVITHERDYYMKDDLGFCGSR